VGAGGGHPRRYVCGARRLRGPVRVRESGAPDLPGGAGLLVRAARLPGSVSVRRHSPGPPLRAQRLVGGLDSFLSTAARDAVRLADDAARIRLLAAWGVE